MGDLGEKRATQRPRSARITPELVRAIAERVVARLLRDRELEAERARFTVHPARRRRGYR